MTPPKKLELQWINDLTFKVRSAGREMILDGAAQAGGSPMEMVLMGVAGCMAIDIVHILQKMRGELKSLKARAEGQRADSDPKRFTRITLHFEVSSDNVTAKEVERAIALSREKYCSVYHSLRPDIVFETSYELIATPTQA